MTGQLEKFLRDEANSDPWTNGCRRMNRRAFEQLTKENLEWLKAQPKTLERDHIILIVERSPDYEYGKDQQNRLT